MRHPKGRIDERQGRFSVSLIGENHPAPVETILSRQGVFIADIRFVRFLIDYFQYQFVCPAFLELVFQMIASVDQFTVQVPLDGEKFVYISDVG